ncbi:MAG: transketolase [Gemmatimonadota bacterium]|nr:MAG: transketolase [Gemmatimonadota bacterium]
MVTNKRTPSAELERIARTLRRHIITMTTQAGSGHPSSSVSMVEILVALFFGGILRHKPDQPDWPDRDRFILSKGHGCPGLYAVLAERGYFPVSWFPDLRQLGSPLEGHPNMLRVPGIEASTGSLGQGLSIGIGHALAARLEGRDYRSYVMIGDGESQQGQVWEAAMTASKYGLDNLTAICDFNHFQQTGRLEDVMPALEPLRQKWEAFGWYVMEIDGHNYNQIFAALDKVLGVKVKPQIIIARTVKGKGIRIIEEETAGNRKHGVPLTQEEADIALAELGE